MKRTSLKRYTPLRPSCTKISTKLVQNRTCSGIKKVSKTQSKINYIWNKTVKICKVRCGGVCEVRGPDCLVTYGITPHHVIPRARGGCHLPRNCIMGCGECHNHHKYANGIPLEIPFALELVKKLNEEAGIEAG
jgi:hypothetical protein